MSVCRIRHRRQRVAAAAAAVCCYCCGAAGGGAASPCWRVRASLRGPSRRPGRLPSRHPGRRRPSSPGRGSLRAAPWPLRTSQSSACAPCASPYAGTCPWICNQSYHHISYYLTSSNILHLMKACFNIIAYCLRNHININHSREISTFKFYMVKYRKNF